MDMLSDVLQSLRLSGAIFLRGEFTTPWGVAAPTAADMARMLQPGPGHGLVFHIVATGQCWIRLDNGRTASLCAPGVFLMPHGHAHFLADRDGRPFKPVGELLPPPPWSEFPVLDHGGGGEATKIICGYLYFASRFVVPLLEDLPDLIAIDLSASPTTSGLRAVLDYTMEQAGDARPGTASLVFRLAELFFVEIIRRHSDTMAPLDKGWFAAATDPVIARALALLHAEPAFPWTVEALARRAATSRSTLAGRFKRRFGHGPMQYLAKWRVHVAARQLTELSVSVAEAAAGVGYASESAFYRAFRREFGMSPASWRRRTGEPGPAAFRQGR